MEGTRVAVHPSREEHYGQPLGGVEGDAEGSARRPTTDDAMSYLGELKDTLRDEPEKYNTFVEIMKDFKSQRIDAMMVVARVKELFTGYERLIHGFNTFLPDGCKISPDEPRKLVSFEEVIGFVIKVKERFQSEENVYLSFLDAWRGNNPIRVVYNEVAGLFAGHPDLLEEFKRLLPEISQDQEEVSSITTPTSRRLEMDRTRQDGIADSQAKDRATVDHPHLDHPHLDDDEEIMKVYEDEVKRFEGRVQLIVSAIYSVLAILVFLLALWIYRGN